MKDHRVVITGAASITTLGVTHAELISNLVDKKTNIVRRHDTVNAIPIEYIGLCNRAHPCFDRYRKKGIKAFSSQALLYLLEEVFKDADLEPDSVQKELLVFLGSTFGNRPDYFRLMTSLLEHKSAKKEDQELDGGHLPEGLEELFQLRFREDALTNELNAVLPFRINKHTVQAQCVSGILSVMFAANLVRSGQYRMAMVGSYDFFETFVYMIMKQHGLLSDRPSRPFDKNNTGMNFADGAAMMLLEDYDSAVKRGVSRFYGEIKGCGVATHPDADLGPSIKAIARSAQMAMCEAGLEHQEIDLISPHGNGNPVLDRKERLAFQRCFKDKIKQIPMASYVANLGYAFAGSGLVDMVIASDCLMNNRIIGTISPESVDPEYDFNYAFGENLNRSINHYLKTKVNITGTAAALVVAKVA